MTPEQTPNPINQPEPGSGNETVVGQPAVPGSTMAQTPASQTYPQAMNPEPVAPMQPAPTVAPQQMGAPQPFNAMAPGAAPSPQMPVAAAVYAPAPFTPAAGQPAMTDKPKRSKKKLVALVFAGLFGLLFLAGAGYGVYSRVTNLPITYTKADLVSTKASSYSIRNPKQWVDYTNDKSKLKTIRESLGTSSDSVQDQKILAYKYDPKTDIPRTVLFTGKSSLGVGVSDDQLREGLKVATTKKSFEDGFSGITKDLTGGSKCASTTGEKISFDYPDTGLVVVIKADVECIYDAKTQASSHSKSDHTSVIFEIKNGNGYLGAIISAGDDWAKNSTFYKDDVLASLMPN
jgi:hypothetical protein